MSKRSLHPHIASGRSDICVGDREDDSNSSCVALETTQQTVYKIQELRRRLVQMEFGGSERHYGVQ